MLQPKIYSGQLLASQWLERFQGKDAALVCVLGFTETGLIPGISAAGATPSDRAYTALADAEFLVEGCQPTPSYPLPPLEAGASPVLISRAVLTGLALPLYLFNAGLRHSPAVACIDLGGEPARCVTTGQALRRPTVQHLFQQGLHWGEKLAQDIREGYLILSECVVGGTTTALGVLLGLGWQAARDRVNSSHPVCNHLQKLAIVSQGLGQANLSGHDPWEVVAAVGDPMQIVVAGMAIAASQRVGVLLAGGTQMLAVYALIQALVTQPPFWDWQPQNVIVGTTRWVAEDPSGDTPGLAQLLGEVPLVATPLSFATSRYRQLRAYEQGFVKEGVGAGGCSLAAHLTGQWSQAQLISRIEELLDQMSSHHRC